MSGPTPPDDAGAANPWQRLDDLYADRPPWEIGRPQRVFLDLARSGAVRGRVLDVGCGTGEHVLMCAALGLDATGVDLAASALRAAEDKARRRGLSARFLHHDARGVADLGERFDTVLDSGLFHILDPEDRTAFASGLRAVLRPGGRYFMLCFSDREPLTPGARGPHRLTRDDITAAFAGALRIDSIEPATIEIVSDPAGIRAWSVAMTADAVPTGTLAGARVATRLPAQDLDRARRFYSERLGLEPVDERPGGLLYRCAGAEFVLFRSMGASPGTFTQMALTVDDIESVVSELKRRGVVFEEVDAPGFRTKDGIAEIEGNYPSKGARGERGAWFRDSEGNMLGIGEPVA
ncbi:methyltransferase domain-containing protein [Streptomyces sp. NPDC059943]|uniref:methyltransferase domain-containing protein n=2 Tax=unclassified Streptomyces TaxID=2593676 RepID=UPI00364CA4C5